MLRSRILIGSNIAMEHSKAQFDADQSYRCIDEHKQGKGPETALLDLCKFTVSHCQFPPSSQGMWWEQDGYPRQTRNC